MQRYRPAFFDRLRGGNQFGELVGTVVPALGWRRLGLQTEAEIASAVLRAMQQIVNFMQISGSAFELVFDDPPPQASGLASHTAPGMPLSRVNSWTVFSYGRRYVSSATASTR